MKTLLLLTLFVLSLPHASASDASPDPSGLHMISWAHSMGCEVEVPLGFEEAVEAAAEKHGIDSRILSTTVWRETGCRPLALGTSGEIGLTQVNPHVWAETLIHEGIIGSVEDLWKPETNLEAGAFVLAYCQNRFGDLRTTFRCYNGSGPGAERYATDQLAAYLSAWSE